MTKSEQKKKAPTLHELNEIDRKSQRMLQEQHKAVASDPAGVMRVLQEHEGARKEMAAELEVASSKVAEATKLAEQAQQEAQSTAAEAAVSRKAQGESEAKAAEGHKALDVALAEIEQLKKQLAEKKSK